MNKSEGFSLLELVVALAIVGLLTTVALPAYQRNIQSGARAEGQRLLLQVAAEQERFYASHHSYSVSASPTSVSSPMSLLSEGGLYEVTVAACVDGTIANCFVATATPMGTQSDDICGVLALSSAGLKAASGGSARDCWR